MINENGQDEEKLIKKGKEDFVKITENLGSEFLNSPTLKV